MSNLPQTKDSPGLEEPVSPTGPSTFTCESCGGDGTSACDNCDGKGKVACPECQGLKVEPKDSERLGQRQPPEPTEAVEEQNQCSRCGGAGTVDCEACEGEGTVECPDCQGKGVLKKGEV